VRIALSWWRSLASAGRHADADSRMGWLILVGTLPIALLGLLFKDAIETSLRNLYITAGDADRLFALLLWAADRFGAQRRTLKTWAGATACCSAWRRRWR
jgi:undecaprenyl-diphosphatase